MDTLGNPIVFSPDEEIKATMRAHQLQWAHRHQRFSAGDWDWEARICMFPDGTWVATYSYDDGAIGMHGRRWEGSRLASPIACLLEAKLANWGN